MAFKWLLALCSSKKESGPSGPPNSEKRTPPPRPSPPPYSLQDTLARAQAYRRPSKRPDLDFSPERTPRHALSRSRSNAHRLSIGIPFNFRKFEGAGQMLSAHSRQESDGSYLGDDIVLHGNTYLQDVMFNMQNSPEGEVFELPDTSDEVSRHRGPPSELLPTPVLVWSQSSSIYNSRRNSRSVPDLVIYTDKETTAPQTTSTTTTMSPLRQHYPPSMSWLSLLREEDSDDDADYADYDDGRTCGKRVSLTKSLSDLRQPNLPEPLSPARARVAAMGRISHQRSGSIPNRISQAIFLQRTNPDVRRRTRSPPPSPHAQRTPLPDVPSIPAHYLTPPSLSPPTSPITTTSPVSPVSPPSRRPYGYSHRLSHRLSRPFPSAPPPIPARSHRRPAFSDTPERNGSPTSASTVSSAGDSDFSMSTDPTEWDVSASPMRIGRAKGFERGVKIVEVGPRSFTAAV